MPTILSYNLNGIRAAMKKGLIDWLQAGNYDIMGVQETKAQEEQVDLQAFENIGYKYIYWHSAEKKGYSGVAIFSKIKADYVEIGMGIEKFDKEGRVIRADFGDWTLINAYFPSGTSGEERQNIKYEFLDAFYDWVQELRKQRPKLLIQGDYNIAHSEMEIHDPKGNVKSSGFLPEERAWLSKWLEEGGFVDSFRELYPEVRKYTWWTMRSKTAREQDKGWRIDYQCLTKELLPNLVESKIFKEAEHSDHCPCYVELK